MRNLFQIFIGIYLSSPNPKLTDTLKQDLIRAPLGLTGLIGRSARTRKTEKENLANKFYDKASDIDDQIAEEQSQNPWETAGAKSAMKRTSRAAKQFEQRTANQLGAGASAEALISAQGKANETIGQAAGAIATGAEAQKQTNINNLRNRQTGLMSTGANIQSGAISEIGQGWKDFFSNAEGAAKIAEGVGSAASVL